MENESNETFTYIFRLILALFLLAIIRAGTIYAGMEFSIPYLDPILNFIIAFWTPIIEHTVNLFKWIISAFTG